MNKRHLTRIVTGTALILAVPLVAMSFTDEVNWNLFDFAVIGGLLLGAGLTYELLTTRVSPKHRGAIAVIVGAAVLLIWAEMAVGIFGSPIAGS